MKTLLMAITYCVITSSVIAQVDSAEKKLLPPDYEIDTVYNSDKAVQDTMKAVPDKTKVVTQPQDQQSTPGPAKSQSMLNGYMLKNGKVYMIKNGQASSTVATVSLSNGSRLVSDGTVIKSDGSRIKMQEGDFIDFSGNVINHRPTDVQNTKPVQQNPPVDKSKEQKKDNNKNMYLVPDSSINNYNKQNPH